MAKRTLLQLVQDIGTLIGSDEIDELYETQETVDILAILRMTFNNVIARRDWEFTKNQPRLLDDRDVGDTQINRLNLPTDVAQLSTLRVRYRSPVDGRNEVFKDLQYLSPSDFLTLVQEGNENDSNIDTILNDDSVPMLIRNDVDPTYYTSFDEDHIWFDAYDSARGTGNLSADAVIFATIIPSMDWTDANATLPVPERMELLIFEEAVVSCAARIRQVNDPLAARQATIHHNKLREQEARVNRDTEEIDYGRRKGNRGAW